MERPLSQGLTRFLTCHETTECNVIVLNALNCLEITNECGVPPRAESIGPRTYRAVTRWCVSTAIDSHPSPFRNLLTASDQPWDLRISECQLPPLVKMGVIIGLSS